MEEQQMLLATESNLVDISTPEENSNNHEALTLVQSTDFNANS